MTGRGVAVETTTRGLVTMIPVGVDVIYLQVLSGSSSVRVELSPEAAGHLRDFVTEWLSKFEVGPDLLQP